METLWNRIKNDLGKGRNTWNVYTKTILVHVYRVRVWGGNQKNEEMKKKKQRKKRDEVDGTEFKEANIQIQSKT